MIWDMRVDTDNTNTKIGCGPRREVCCDKSVGVQRDAKKAKANCVTTNFATGP